MGVGNKNYGFIRPEYLKPELSTKLYRTTYSYLSRFYSTQLFDDICKEVGIPSAYLLEEDNWVSASFGAKFARLVTEKTGDPEVYRKIGHFYYSPENLSAFETSLLKSLSPYLVMKAAEQFYRKRNAICNFKLINKGFGHYRFEISSSRGLYYEMAQNSLGTLEAFQNFYDLDLFNIDFEIDDREKPKFFAIEIKFAAFNFYLKRLVRLAGLAAVGGLFGFALWQAEHAYKVALMPVLTGLAYLSGFLAWKSSRALKVYRQSVEESHNKVREKNQNLYEKSELLERRYQEANLLKKLSTQLVGCKDPHQVIETCLASIRDNFSYKRAAVFLISREREKLYLANSVGFNMGQLDPSKIEFQFPNPDKKEGFIATALERGETTLILDVDSYKQILKPNNRMLLEAMRVGSLIISPIQSSEKKFGAFVLIREQTEPLLGKDDKFLVENITSLLSLYFESASNFENEVKLRSIFQKYVPRTALEQITERLHTSDGMLAPRRLKICSVFMDLRGFTSACDGASPERVFLLINLFAEFATSHLADQGAIIDNIIGDEIVCFFTQDPQAPQDHITRALRAVAHIKTQFPTLIQKLQQYGFPELKLGVGVHCGEASVGSVGGDAKINFTALGSTVNIASRLQSLSKKFTHEQVTVIASYKVIESLRQQSFFKDRVENEILRGTSEQTPYVNLSEQDLSHLSRPPDGEKKVA